MANAIKNINEQHQDVVVVIGDGHIEGIRRILEDRNVEIIRLSELRQNKSKKTDDVTISYRYSTET
jgi:pheromone shutdown protein TraB